MGRAVGWRPGGRESVLHLGLISSSRAEHRESIESAGTLSEHGIPLRLRAFDEHCRREISLPHAFLDLVPALTVVRHLAHAVCGTYP